MMPVLSYSTQQQRAAYQLGRGDAAISVLIQICIQICKRLLDIQLSLGKQQGQTHQVTGRILCAYLSQIFDHRCSTPAVMVRCDFEYLNRERIYGNSDYIIITQCLLQKADDRLKLTVLACQQYNAGLCS